MTALQKIADAIVDETGRQGTPERAEKEKEYLKSELEHLGTKVPLIRKTTTKWVRSERLDREGVLALVGLLWERPIHESRSAAVEALRFQTKDLLAEDLPYVEQLIRESKTWALVDNLAVRITGDLVERHPKLLKTLDRWAKDEDFWVRRSAMLALLLPLRDGEGDFERFSRYADAMLDEKEFFIRKSIGWVLRETSKKRPELVYDWLKPRAERASGVTMREAVRYLPDDQRLELMEIYRNRQK